MMMLNRFCSGVNVIDDCVVVVSFGLLWWMMFFLKFEGKLYGLVFIGLFRFCDYGGRFGGRCFGFIMVVVFLVVFIDLVVSNVVLLVSSLFSVCWCECFLVFRKFLGVCRRWFCLEFCWFIVCFVEVRWCDVFVVVGKKKVVWWCIFDVLL